MKKKDSKKIQELYCVISDGNDEFDTPTEGKLGYYEVAVGADTTDVLKRVGDEVWEINDKLAVYKLVLVGYIDKGKPTFNKLDKTPS